ncbi:MAG: filamentous hemagglutinin N-terminal domain-containing protein [Xenococcaceae cyanobacterium MO_207.B15]|nr:filamentous hemagglutinin N-terminal domain-containing protein [Xenococcaceae cyanobacterium MO_207.B15]
MKLISSSILGLCCGTTLIAPASAQITTDGTTNTTVTPTDNGIQIDNGSRAGGNLFHSFEEFSIPNGSEAFFNNASDIVNILSRVTGGNISNIDGLIRANGAANLFLINPAGIIFGEGARLDIGGSFNIERLNLQDGGQISSTSGIATSQENITQAGAAGNITINASESIEISGGSDNIVVPSLIAISSFTENSAGDINITTNSLSLFNIQDQGQIFSSDDFSLETNSVSVEEQEVRPEPILIPETLISSLHRVVAPREPLNSEIAQICHPRTTQAKSEFIITGRGGITPNTLEALQINPIAPDWVELPEAQNNSSEISSSSFSVPNPTPQIVEAIGWIRDESGEVILVADVNNVTGYDSMQKPRQCANN